MRRWPLWLPLALFVALVGVVAAGLIRPDDRSVPSRLVGQLLPAFALPPSVPGHPGLASADLRGGAPKLLNIFASWCVPCAAEAPQLLALRREGVAIAAIAIRDRPEDTARFLARFGDPYARIGRDDDSAVQMALGSSGVPESFVIDGRGMIRLQHIGPIMPEHLPAIRAALAAAR